MEKNKKKSAWLWILLCLPMVFIVYYFITLSGTDIDVEKVSAVEVTAPDGEKFSFTKKEDIEFYVEMFLNSAPLPSPLREVDGDDCFNVSIARPEGNVSFKLYPEVNTNGCFFTKESGEHCALLSEHATGLLQRSEYEAVYENAGCTLPTLYFASGGGSVTVLPSEYSWQYQNIANAGVDYKGAARATEPQRFNYNFKIIDNPIDFSVEPEERILTFTDPDGNVLKETEFSTLYRTNDTVLKVRLEARWGSAGRALGGTAVYEFEVFYDVLPELKHHPIEAVAGDMIYLTFSHLSADETITLDTQLKTSELKVIYGKDDDYAHIVLPLSIDNDAGDYSLAFTIGQVKESFTLSVKKADSSLVRERMDTELYTQSLTPDKIASYQALLKEWGASDNEGLISFGSKFSKPVSGDVLYDFGTYMSVNDVVPYFHLESIDYAVTDKDTVKATKKGVIIYMGEDDIHGKMVVIDHGYGILSHYYNLGAFSESKAVGDTVQEGEIIGTGGISGMTYKNGEEAVAMLRFAITVNGVFVDPNSFYQAGLNITE